MQLHQLQRAHANKTTKRIGRGSTRGKTSGRGHKGQKAHGGHGIRPEERDIIKRLPKLRGHGKNRARSSNPRKEKPQVLNIARLDALFEAGETVTPTTLLAKGVLKRHNGRTPSVKILGHGELTKKLTVEGCTVSETARAHIEKSGGSVA